MVKGLKRKSGYQSLKCLGAKGLLKKKKETVTCYFMPAPIWKKWKVLI